MKRETRLFKIYGTQQKQLKKEYRALSRNNLNFTAKGVRKRMIDFPGGSVVKNPPVMQQWRKWSHSVVSNSLQSLDCTVHGIVQGRILEWLVFPFFRGSSKPRDWTQVSPIAGGFFTSWATREALCFCFGFYTKACDWVDHNKLQGCSTSWNQDCREKYP